MKKMVLIAGVLTVALFGFAAFAGGPITMDVDSTSYAFSCNSSGTGSQTVAVARYLVTVTKEDVFLCYASSCPSGGIPLPMGTSIWWNVGRSGGQVMTCRSAASTGVLNFQRTF